MRYYFKFNNKNSDDIHVLVKKRPNIPIAKRKITTQAVYGHNGAVVYDEEAYEDIEITVACNFADSISFQERTRIIKDWLMNISDEKLTFSDDLDYFYKVKYVNCDEIARAIRRFGSFEIKFTCDPFLYAYSGQQTITKTETSFEFLNNGYKAVPYMKIYGNTASSSSILTVTVNDNQFMLSNITDYVEIDSEIMDCFKGSIAKNTYMNGDFPVFESGENMISFDTANGFTFNKVEIIPRWRYL